MRVPLQVYITILILACIAFCIHAETHEPDTAIGILSDTESEKPVKQLDSLTGESSGSNKEKNIISIKRVRDIFTLLVKSFKQEYPQSVAVFPFDSSYQGRVTGEVAVDFFSNHPNFWVVKKESYVSVIKSMPIRGNYQDMDQIINAGIGMKVTFCVVGSIQITESDYIITTTMIQVEQKRIVAQVSARIDMKRFDTHIEEVCHVSDKKIIPYYATFQSLLIPGLGQRYYGHKRGYIMMGLTAAGIGGTIYLANKYNERQETLQLYKDHDLSTVENGLSPLQWVTLADDAREKRNTAAARLNIALAGLGVLWVYNMVDALIIDKKIAKKFPAVYFSYIPGVNNFSPDRTCLSVTLKF